MTDRRPSENTDTPFAAVAEYGRTHLGWEPADDERDPVDDLIERAQNAHDPAQGLVYAQLATVRAIQSLALEVQLAVARSVQTSRTEFRISNGDQ